MWANGHPIERRIARYTGGLFVAVAMNDSETVKEICHITKLRMRMTPVRARAARHAIENVDAVGPGGMTPLLLASSHGFVEIMWWLLDAGADPDLEDDDGLTALAVVDSTEAAECLLQHGADPLANNSGWQALRLACRDGRLQMVQRLLDRGVVPNDDDIDPQGPTPMMLACAGGHLACVQHLSVHGASRSCTAAWADDDLAPNGLQVPDGESVRTVAAGGNHDDLVDFLDRSAEWCTALHHLTVVPAGRVRLLLRCGADVHARASAAGPSPLDLARALGASGRAEAGTGAALVLAAAEAWSPRSHSLFPTAARRRASTLLQLGYMMSAAFRGAEAAWTEVWRTVVLPHALDRGASDAPSAAAAAASAVACAARDAPRAAAAAERARTRSEAALRARIKEAFAALTNQGLPPQEAAVQALEMARRCP